MTSLPISSCKSHKVV